MFDGSLIRVGDNAEILPLRFIKAESYQVTPNIRQDMDPYRDANGELHRAVVSHLASTITMDTVPMNNQDMAYLMAFIREHFSNETERKLHLYYYCPDTDSYKWGYFYIPDFVFPIIKVNAEKMEIIYDSITLEFIEY